MRADTSDLTCCLRVTPLSRLSMTMKIHDARNPRLSTNHYRAGVPGIVGLWHQVGTKTPTSRSEGPSPPGDGTAGPRGGSPCAAHPESANVIATGPSAMGPILIGGPPSRVCVPCPTCARMPPIFSEGADTCTSCTPWQREQRGAHA